MIHAGATARLERVQKSGPCFLGMKRLKDTLESGRHPAQSLEGIHEKQGGTFFYLIEHVHA